MYGWKTDTRVATHNKTSSGNLYSCLFIVYYLASWWLESISSRFGSPVAYPPPTNVVWGKGRGLTKQLEIEPTWWQP